TARPFPAMSVAIVENPSARPIGTGGLAVPSAATVATSTRNGTATTTSSDPSGAKVSLTSSIGGSSEPEGCSRSVTGGAVPRCTRTDARPDPSSTHATASSPCAPHASDRHHTSPPAGSGVPPSRRPDASTSASSGARPSKATKRPPSASGVESETAAGHATGAAFTFSGDDHAASTASKTASTPPTVPRPGHGRTHLGGDRPTPRPLERLAQVQRVRRGGEAPVAQPVDPARQPRRLVDGEQIDAVDPDRRRTDEALRLRVPLAE